MSRRQQGDFVTVAEKAAPGAEAGVGLYGTVGVSDDLAPYVRGEASGTAGTATKADASWAVYGGVDLSGTLRIRLSIFGTPVSSAAVRSGTQGRHQAAPSGAHPWRRSTADTSGAS